jgi:hypothetical protein
MKNLQALLTQRPWVWAATIYVLNFAILRMVSFVAECNDAGVTPRVCEVTRPLSQLGVLSMISLAVAFPSMLTSVASVKLDRWLLNASYIASITILTLGTFVLYQKGYFNPLDMTCAACDRVFLTQVIVNMLWVFVVFPGAFLVPYLWKEHRAGRL